MIEIEDSLNSIELNREKSALLYFFLYSSLLNQTHSTVNISKPGDLKSGPEKWRPALPSWNIGRIRAHSFLAQAYQDVRKLSALVNTALYLFRVQKSLYLMRCRFGRLITLCHTINVAGSLEMSSGMFTNATGCYRERQKASIPPRLIGKWSTFQSRQ
jgi:hypothetical protein